MSSGDEENVEDFKGERPSVGHGLSQDDYLGLINRANQCPNRYKKNRDVKKAKKLKQQVTF